MIKRIFERIPRRWRVRGETEAEIEGKATGFSTALKHDLDYGFPAKAAIADALQKSGTANVEAVMNRMSDSDVDRIVERVGEGDEILPKLVRETQYAAHEATRDLLARILRGELDDPDGTPRSVVNIVERLSQKDLKLFLKLRRVLWIDMLPTPRLVIYCMYDSAEYPGLLNRYELGRLDELGLVSYGPISFQSNFPGPVARKILSFAGREIAIISTKPDATLYLGHWALTSDGEFLLGLYEDDQTQVLDNDFEITVAAWREQGFQITDHVTINI